jgi:hypothetical protein
MILRLHSFDSDRSETANFPVLRLLLYVFSSFSLAAPHVVGQNTSALMQGNCFWCAKQSAYYSLKITHLLSDPLEDLFGYA